MDLSISIVTFVCGLPLTGKSTIARALSERFGVVHLDIDETFRPGIIELPHPDPYSSEELTRVIRAEMVACYDLLFFSIGARLGLGRSTIATATLSRQLSQENLAKVVAEHPGTKLRIIWCRASNGSDTDGELECRLAARRHGASYFGGCTSVAHYRADQARYVPIALPHLAIDTFPPHTVEECVAAAVSYINA